MPKPIESILIGAGQRGADVYGAYALEHPDQFRFIAVAEPDPNRRARFSAQHGIPPEAQYPSWEPLFAGRLSGEAAFVCTLDWQHTAPTIAALERGYHVLLEKPMATTPQECRQLVRASEAAGRQLHICHVLRYTPHFQTVREIVQSGRLGQVINVSHRENVSWWHMTHSYVRGNWRSSMERSPMILTKCCHDFDILLWVLDRQCEMLGSFGELSHFRVENAPDGAPERCLDGCPVSDTCPYYAPFIYQTLAPLWRSYGATSAGLAKLAVEARQRVPVLANVLASLVPRLRRYRDYRGWPLSVLAQDPNPDNVRAALQEGPYGRCVYQCDNDVVDHQIVAMQFEGGVSGTLTMHGHAHIEGRSTRVEGSRATLDAHFGIGGSWVKVRDHRQGRQWRYNTSAPVETGHGGGDRALMAAFFHSLQTGGPLARTTVRQSLESHLLAFAAEWSRLEKRVITRADWGLP